MALPPIPKINEGRNDPILEPDIPIIDTHHHLFDRPHHRYLLDDYLEDAALGHNIVATVYMETLSMARAWGPETLRPVGEVEFANGAAAMCDSGTYGKCRVAAAIVGFGDMTLGERIAETLDRSQSAAPDRYRGIRHVALFHPDPTVLRFMTHVPPADLLLHPNFRKSFGEIARRNMSFDTAVLHPQLPEVAALAAAFPDTAIVLNHLGIAMATDRSPEGMAETFKVWRANIRELAKHQNVYCKIGGLGMFYWGFGFIERKDTISHLELATTWKPYIDAVVEAFGADRCMMETNFPNDGRTCGFVPLWNALKYAVKDYSADEKADLFHRTAAKAYRINLNPA